MTEDARKFVYDPDSPVQKLANANAEAAYELKYVLVAHRNNNGQSRADIAELLGWKEKKVKRFEKYWYNPTMEEVRGYALAVGARVTYNVTREEIGL